MIVAVEKQNNQMMQDQTENNFKELKRYVRVIYKQGIYNYKNLLNIEKNLKQLQRH